MSNDVIARLAAANPVPTGAPLHASPALRVRRLAVAAVVAAAIAIPAVAFAGQLADVLGISNEGTPVSTSSVLPGQGKLDDAIRELKVGSTMQLLGTLNGVRFYAARNADGHLCLAIDHVDAQYEKGFGCDLNADDFPSANVQALTFPVLTRLQGVAADGVVTVQALDENGNVLDSTPVEDNLFATTTDIPAGATASIRTLDANGNATATEPLPKAP